MERKLGRPARAPWATPSARPACTSRTARSCRARSPRDDPDDAPRRPRVLRWRTERSAGPAPDRARPRARGHTKTAGAAREAHVRHPRCSVCSTRFPATHSCGCRGVHRDVHRAGAQNCQPLLEVLFEFLAGASLHQHVPSAYARGLAFFSSGPSPSTRSAWAPPDLALPLRRDLRLDREGHPRSMPLLAMRTPRPGAGPGRCASRLVAGHHEARAAKSSLTHESCLPGLVAHRTGVPVVVIRSTSGRR